MHFAKVYREKTGKVVLTPEREQELLKMLADGVVNYAEEGVVKGRKTRMLR